MSMSIGYPALQKSSSSVKSKNKYDAFRRALFRKYESRRKMYKSMAYDSAHTLEERRQALYQLQKIPRNASPVRQKKRCVLTGRSKGIVSDFRMSRLCVRELAGEGMLPGVIKSSW